jgi:hypothetical protein
MDGVGYADLVVGASGEAVGDAQGAGSVTVVFGDRSGLSRKAVAFHTPAPTPRGRFGGRLTLGEFNDDGLRDLAVVEGHDDLVTGAHFDGLADEGTLAVPPGSGDGVRSKPLRQKIPLPGCHQVAVHHGERGLRLRPLAGLGSSGRRAAVVTGTDVGGREIVH